MREVGSIDRLKALYLLTFADMRAVAPNVYNNWRDMLLSDLYMRALKILEHGHREAVDPARRLACGQSRGQVASSRKSRRRADDDPEIPRRDARPLLLHGTRKATLQLHFELMRTLGEHPLVTRHRHFPDLEFSEFIVVTRDQPGLFSMIAGALTANNLNILSARITTRNTGIALDVFRVSHLGTDRRGGAGRRSMAAGGARPRTRHHGASRTSRTWSRRRITSETAGRKFVRRVATEVTIDNRTSEEYTVIDVFTQDRVGLLFAITHTLFELGLLIHLARITTNADQALDVFYISDREGNKITDLAGAARICAKGCSKRLEERPAESVAAQNLATERRGGWAGAVVA